MAYIVNPKPRYIEQYEEPCNHCGVQIHYSEDEIVWGDVGCDETGYKNYILCPNCGNRMIVSKSTWSYVSYQINE